jgi:tRNA-dihydrouridine synthase
VVYRKCAGGGLLREPKRVDGILGALREAVSIPFTVKTRIGFDSPAVFDELLCLFQKHGIDLLTVHGRTVMQMYRDGVRYDLIALAAHELRCPVLANGNIYSPTQALELMKSSGVRGLMIGRGAIRSPWLFDQIRQEQAGRKVWLPTGRDLLRYINELWESQITEPAPEHSQVQRMKKFMNFIGEGISPEFLFQIRRVETKASFFSVCAAYLEHEAPMSLIPAKSPPVLSDTAGVSSEFDAFVSGRTSVATAES